MQSAPCDGPGQPSCGEDGSVVDMPDVAMDGVARHRKRFFSQTQFYKDAASGSLPALSWYMPPTQACDHPCCTSTRNPYHNSNFRAISDRYAWVTDDTAKGERVLKDVYESLRAGPNWEKTLFMVMYDDAGGWYDHVVPPSEGVPNDEAPCNVNISSNCAGRGAFDFKRLGQRSAAMLISPWVEKAGIIQEPKCSAEQMKFGKCPTGPGPGPPWTAACGAALKKFCFAQKSAGEFRIFVSNLSSPPPPPFPRFSLTAL